MQVLIFYAPLQLFLGVNISYLKSQMVGHFTVYETVPTIHLTPILFEHGGRHCWAGLTQCVLKARLTLNALTGPGEDDWKGEIFSI